MEENGVRALKWAQMSWSFHMGKDSSSSQEGSVNSEKGERKSRVGESINEGPLLQQMQIG